MLFTIDEGFFYYFILFTGYTTITVNHNLTLLKHKNKLESVDGGAKYNHLGKVVLRVNLQCI